MSHFRYGTAVQLSTINVFPLRPECQALDFGLSFSSKIIKKFIFGKLEHKNHNQTSASKTLNNFELHASFVEASLKLTKYQLSYEEDTWLVA